MEVRESAALNFGDLQVVKLGDCCQIGLPDTTLGGQQPTDELNGVVPQP
jgi:hypothetical protein